MQLQRREPDDYHPGPQHRQEGDCSDCKAQQLSLCRKAQEAHHGALEPRFLSIDDLVDDQGELALTIDFNASDSMGKVSACTVLPNSTSCDNLTAAYVSLCDLDSPTFNTLADSTQTVSLVSDRYLFHSKADHGQHVSPTNVLPPLVIYAGKKYKLVTLKVWPVETKLPSHFRIIRDIKGDPLENMLVLPTQPEDFVPTGCYTMERKEQLDKVHTGSFLLPEERKLMHHFMCMQNEGFAWNDTERGHFHEDFFPPIEMPTIPHKPWFEHNIPIPSSIYNEVCRLIKRKIDAGVYKPSNSSYCSKWFCVAKKDGKSLCIIHSLELLNKVTIKHAGITPFTDQIGEHFTGCACSGMLDLYVGYDERGLAPDS